MFFCNPNLTSHHVSARSSDHCSRASAGFRSAILANKPAPACKLELLSLRDWDTVVDVVAKVGFKKCMLGYLDWVANSDTVVSTALIGNIAPDYMAASRFCLRVGGFTSALFRPRRMY